MVWLKGCPKCRGDLFQDHDGTGPVLTCIQCGRSLSRAEMDGIQGRLAARARQAVRAAAAADRSPHLVVEDPERPAVAG